MPNSWARLVGGAVFALWFGGLAAVVVGITPITAVGASSPPQLALSEALLEAEQVREQPLAVARLVEPGSAPQDDPGSTRDPDTHPAPAPVDAEVSGAPVAAAARSSQDAPGPATRVAGPPTGQAESATPAASTSPGSPRRSAPAVPTATPTPRPTATPTPRPTATVSPTATVTPPPAAATVIATPRPTATPTPRPTATPTPRPTATPRPRPTATPTPQPAATLTPRRTATPTPRPTATPTPRPTATPTPRPTATPTPRPTPTPTPTATATPAPAATPAATPPPTPPRADGTLLRRVGYEAGEGRNEYAHTATSDGLTTTNEASRAGRSAGVALLEAGTPQWKGNIGFRSEWHGGDAVADHVERWQGISYLVPADWHRGVNPKWSPIRIVFQWHATGSIRVSNGQPVGQTSPIYGLLLAGPPDAPELVFYRKDAYVSEGRLRGRNVTLWSERVQPGRWTDFAFNTIWSTGSDGKMVVYRNGEEVYRHAGPTLTANTNVYSKWGIYGQPTRILFDEIRIADGKNLLDLVSP